MGFAVGVSAAIDLRILGVAPNVPLQELRRFLPILWAGFWLNAVSGVLLLIGYPTKALTNPVFYLKLTLIAVAMVLLVRISRQVFATGSGASLSPLDRLDPPISSRLRNLAIASLVCWSWSDHRRTATRLHVPSAHPVALTMHDFQIWLVTTIGGKSAIAEVMRTAWAWPIAESLHFLGLCLLVGAIGTFDLRLLGVAMAGADCLGASLHPMGFTRVCDQYRHGHDVHPDRAGSIHLQSVVSLQTAVHDHRRPQRRDVLSDVLPPPVWPRRATRCAAARQGHRGDLALRVDLRHHRRSPPHLLSPRPVRGSADDAAPDVRSVTAL